MACTLLGEAEHGEYVITAKGVTYSETFSVVSDDGTDGEADAAAVVSIAVGDYLGFGDSYCLSKSVKMVTKDKRNFLVTVNFGQPDKPDFDLAPWDRPAEIDYDGASTNIFIYRDKDNNLMVNSANDPFEPFEFESNRLVVTIRKAYEDGDLPLSSVLGYTNTVNSTTFFGGGEGTWRSRMPRMKRAWEQKWGFYDQYEFVLEYDPFTFDRVILDAGLREKVGSDRKPIIRNNQPVETPWPINSSGAALSATSTSFNYKTFKVHQRADFSFFSSIT